MSEVERIEGLVERYGRGRFAEGRHGTILDQTAKTRTALSAAIDDLCARLERAEGMMRDYCAAVRAWETADQCPGANDPRTRRLRLTEEAMCAFATTPAGASGEGETDG